MTTKDTIKDERPIVVGIGEVVMDCYDDGTKNLGGAPLIFAYHAIKSHCNGVIISALGKDCGGKIDDNGIAIKKEAKEKGVSLVYNTVRDKSSGTVVVKSPQKPQYYITPDAAWSEIKYTKKLKEWEKETKAVYFGTLASSFGGTSKKTIDKFLNAVSEGKTIENVVKDGFLDKDKNVLLKIFDVNLRQDKKGKERITPEQTMVIIDYIKKCNVLKINKKELDVLREIVKIKGKNSDKAGEMLMKQHSNVEILILTKGAKGSTIFWRDKNRDNNTNEISSQSIRIKLHPEHTVGAGDAMVGAFIGELLNGKSISEAYYTAVHRSDKVCRDKDKNSMPKITTPNFFFSYAKVDSGIVDYFYKKFKNNGLDVWMYDHCKTAGENTDDNIKKAIINHQVFVYFSSEAANGSDNVLKELRWFKEKASDDKKIMIIKLDKSSYHKEFHDFLTPLNYIPFYIFESLDKVYNSDIKPLVQNK